MYTHMHAPHLTDVRQAHEHHPNTSTFEPNFQLVHIREQTREPLGLAVQLTHKHDGVYSIYIHVCVYLYIHVWKC
jgi:hypothetical protein